MYTKFLRKISKKGLFGFFGHCSDGANRPEGHCY